MSERKPGTRKPETECWRCAEPSVIVRLGAGNYGLYGLCVAHLIGDTLTAALTAVSNAVRPLGAYGGATDSPWNKGYTQALNEATAALLALRSSAVSSRASETDAKDGCAPLENQAGDFK